MIDRRLIQNIDWVLLGLLLLNSLIGVLFIYSSSHYLPGNFYVRQLFFLGVSLAALFVLLLVDYQVLVDYSYYIYGFVMVVLAGMVVFNHLMKKGSWIRLRYFQVQPSELAKVALVLVMARLFAEYKQSTLTRGAVLAGAGLAAVPFLLVALQPDLGTAVSLLSILAGAFILAGLERKAVIAAAILVIGVGFAGWHFYLKDYQKDRLATVVFPDKDPRGSGYQVLQSKIAIGSGGVLGKGFKRGSQSQLKFLPARHTDFVFSVIGEETRISRRGGRPAHLLCFPLEAFPVRRQGPGPDGGLYRLHGRPDDVLPAHRQRGDGASASFPWSASPCRS